MTDLLSTETKLKIYRDMLDHFDRYARLGVLNQEDKIKLLDTINHLERAKNDQSKKRRIRLGR